MSKFCGTSVSKLYAQFRPNMPDELVRKLKEFMQQDGAIEKYSACIDVGCGPGNSTQCLSKHFPEMTKFLGLDNSPTQIEEARVSAADDERFCFHVSDASTEQFPVTEGSVDLVSCVQSAHWLNLSHFFHECDRVLKPGGVVAIMGYPLCKLQVPGSGKEISRAYTLLWHQFFDQLIEGGYSDPSRSVLFSLFGDVQFPFEDQLMLRNDAELWQTVPVFIEDFFRYVETSSGLRTYQKCNPDGQLYENFKADLKNALPFDVSTGKTKLDIIFSWFLLACKKPW